MFKKKEKEGKLKLFEGLGLLYLAFWLHSGQDPRTTLS